jgi:L-amino acid N-acyltransferase
MPTPSSAVTVRRATIADASSILEIYNEAVATTVATFDTEPRSLESQLNYLREHPSPYVVLVAELEGVVAGWASLSSWSDRKAYAGTSEVSLYVAAERRGRGIGRRLLADLVREGDRSEFHTILARVVDGNAVSLHLHESFGFRPVGVMREVGFKFGRWLDVHLLQRLGPAADVGARGVPSGLGAGEDSGTQS